MHHPSETIQIEATLFLKAKRNLMFWSTALLLIAAAHTGSPISPQVFGAGLSLPPVPLMCGIWLFAAYYFVAFLFEANRVRSRHNGLRTPGGGASVQQRIDEQHREIAAAVTPIADAAQRVLASADQLWRSVTRQKMEWERFSAALNEQNSKVQEISGFIKRRQFDELSMRWPADLEVSDYEQRPHFYSEIESQCDFLTKNIRILDIAPRELSQKLDKYYRALNRFGEQIDGRERLMFNIYDYWFTIAYVIFASTLAISTVFYGPLSEWSFAKDWFAIPAPAPTKA